MHFFKYLRYIYLIFVFTINKFSDVYTFCIIFIRITLIYLKLQNLRKKNYIFEISCASLWGFVLILAGFDITLRGKKISRVATLTSGFKEKRVGLEPHKSHNYSCTIEKVSFQIISLPSKSFSLLATTNLTI